MLKPLPIGIQSFEKLINGTYLYVDKTAYLYRMITEGVAYFLSRPRRFGKSLTVSTLEAIFRGQKELFKGLWIYDQSYDWQAYPVIRIDMSEIKSNVPSAFVKGLAARLKEISEEYDVTISHDEDVETQFRELITKVARLTQQKVVILIDEYDSPIIGCMSSDQIKFAQENKNVLRSFYSVMKAPDIDIKFIFLTGVTKFSRVSVFSGLNNLNDLTMHSGYAGMLGYTDEELDKYFVQHMEQFAKVQNKKIQQVREEVRTWYNGFRFSKVDIRVYNPYSTLLLFNHNDFYDYWFESATPTFLIDLIKKRKYNLFLAEQREVSEEIFSTFEIDRIDILTLLFQSGYFTIKNYNARRKIYRLGYPNKEVEIAFTKNILRVFSKTPDDTISHLFIELENNLDDYDLESFFNNLRTFIAEIPYTIRKAKNEEQEYQLILYAILRCLGMNVGVEVTTNRGRIDAVIQTSTTIYVCEFKLAGTHETALAQIKERGYYEQYTALKKNIVLVGVAIDRKKKNIGAFIAEEFRYNVMIRGGLR